MKISCDIFEVLPNLRYLDMVLFWNNYSTASDHLLGEIRAGIAEYRKNILLTELTKKQLDQED